MPKIYKPDNVYDAAVKRFEFVFSEFDKCYLSFSAGKDSSVMLQIAIDIARRMNKLPLHVLLIDLEGQYKSTIDHAYEMMFNDDVVPYWVCLPLILRNAVSQYQPRWVCWDEAERDNWVRQMPKNCINLENNPWDWFKFGMEFEEFIIEFAKWFSQGDKTACMVGIRADESMNRYRTITSEKKARYNGLGWTTLVKSTKMPVYNAYPIYDWRVEDVWTCVGKHGYKYNRIYDFMYKAGRSIHDMRICQPYGDDQRKGLDLFQMCEPETWDRVVNRVSGANFGSIYKGGTILGVNHAELPEGHTWESYAYLLMDTLPPELKDHYQTKIDVFMRWYKERGYPDGIPDTADIHDEAKRLIPSWRRIAKMIIKNDYWAKTLSFAQTKNDYDRRQLLVEKYRDV